MFCGFGAVVLLVLILNGQVLTKRQISSQDLRAELKRVTLLEEFARADLEKLQKRVRSIELEEGDLESKARKLHLKINQTLSETRKTKEEVQKIERSIEGIKKGLTALKNTTQILHFKKGDRWRSRNRPVGFTGDGRRQYLTGLKLGGNRTLILLDASASMLDETIVNVVRRKLMSAGIRRRSPKWQRAVRTLHWLIANLRPGTKFQVYSFNNRASSVLQGSDGRWLDSSNVNHLNGVLSAAQQLAPNQGTSLHKAFAAIGQFSPKPDSVIVLTDGLPTLGDKPTRDTVISGEERLRLFKAAVRLIPSHVPINTLLFPIEGDPFAAVAFWQLALKTRGSFITPSRDWP